MTDLRVSVSFSTQMIYFTIHLCVATVISLFLFDSKIREPSFQLQMLRMQRMHFWRSVTLEKMSW